MTVSKAFSLFGFMHLLLPLLSVISVRGRQSQHKSEKFHENDKSLTLNYNCAELLSLPPAFVALIVRRNLLPSVYSTRRNMKFMLLSESSWCCLLMCLWERERDVESKCEGSQPVMDAMADARVRVVISVLEPYGREPGTRLWLGLLWLCCLPQHSFD